MKYGLLGAFIVIATFLVIGGINYVSTQRESDPDDLVRAFSDEAWQDEAVESDEFIERSLTAWDRLDRQPDGVEGPAIGPWVYLIPLQGRVGIEVTGEIVGSALGALPDVSRKPDLVVLAIDVSADDAPDVLGEIEQIRRLISAVRDDYRLVAWVERATGPAALIALMCPEMIFSNGAVFAGPAVEDAAPAIVTPAEGIRGVSFVEPPIGDWAADLADEAGWLPALGRAVVDPEVALSADREAGENEHGEPFRRLLDDDADGDVLVSRAGEWLRLDDRLARRAGIALESADTGAEMAVALDMAGWELISRYPVRNVEAWLRSLREAIALAPELLAPFDLVAPDLAPPPPPGTLPGGVVATAEPAEQGLGGEVIGGPTGPGRPKTPSEAPTSPRSSEEIVDDQPPTRGSAGMQLAAWRDVLGDDVFVRVFGHEAMGLLPSADPAATAPPVP